MKDKCFISLVFLMVIIYSCENLNEPVGVEYPLSISSILEVNRSRQEIQLYKALNYEEYIDYYDYGQYFIKGAEINIIENNNVFSDFSLYEKRESYHGNSFFYGNNTKLAIVPGRQYELNVNVNGSEMKGITNVPGDFTINIPTGIRSEDIIDLEVTWTKSESAMFYLYFWRQAYQPDRDSADYHGFDYNQTNYGYLTYEEKAVRENFNPSVLDIDSVSYKCYSIR